MALFKDLSIRTTEMHTGGEPVRIVTSGFPQILGSSLLEKISYARAHFQDVRNFLTLEPRGHRDMYGAVVVEADDPEADIGILVINSADFSNMCGHVTCGVARYAVDHGYTKQRTEPETAVSVQLPSGIMRAFVETKAGKTGPKVRFYGVPSFAAKLDLEIQVEGHGKVKVDIAYGGTFYAICDVRNLGLDIHTCGEAALREAGHQVTAAVEKVFTPTHPEHSDLAYLTGALLTDGKDDFSEAPTVNVYVSRYKQVSRSPCGSGTSARLAAMFAKDKIKLGQKRTIMSGINGTRFTGMVHEDTTCGQYPAVVVEVTAWTYYTGNCEFMVEDGDPLKTGFHVQRDPAC